ncbi:MAG TPA: DUF4058 family protein [Tepidisphaeraceae bacterium]|jgi:hypothetical protein
MPLPFPGMDPYLEDPGLWPDLHLWLISVTAETLNVSLRPNYYARIEDRVYISDQHDPGRELIISDVRVVSAKETAGATARRRPEAGAVATAEPIEVTALIEDEIHEPRIDVIDRASKSVIAVIEVLSPTNKYPGSRGRESYEGKREQVMRSPSHFIEIDLLRSGAGFPPYEALPPHEYRAHVSRVNRRPRGTLWPIRLDQRLPRIPIPLLEHDTDALVDLQDVLNTAYERAAYDLQVDYRSNPAVPLPAEYVDWANRLLREKGLR